MWFDILMTKGLRLNYLRKFMRGTQAVNIQKFRVLIFLICQCTIVLFMLFFFQFSKVASFSVKYTGLCEEKCYNLRKIVFY